MSIPAFNQLTEEEIAQLVHAPAQVTILIAGADQNIDEKETEWGSKIVRIRTVASDPVLHNYYELVEPGFEQALNELMAKYASNAEGLVGELSASLENLNPILEKVDSDYASVLVKSWRGLAKKVAEAEGGILGFGSVNSEESKLIELPMLNG